MDSKLWAAAGAGTLLLVGGAVAVAFATDWGSAKRPATPRTASGTSATQLLRFDEDKDGRITRAEVDATITAQFGKVDTNADGKLDAAEVQRFNDARKADQRARYEAWRAAHPDATSRPPADRARDSIETLRTADWNLDGVITPDEFGGKTRAQAMRADRNGDGTVDPDELKRKNTRRRDAAASTDAKPTAQGTASATTEPPEAGEQ
ncbi:MAG: hypothetical protein KBA31_15175 [Alphaproteobacteria bacterium]|nr:hypothetical protein [Alphaproteobacteria bacterium]